MLYFYAVYCYSGALLVTFIFKTLFKGINIIYKLWKFKLLHAIIEYLFTGLMTVSLCNLFVNLP